jgi:hypothetical protein
MKNTILSFLQTSRKKTITLGELERLAGGQNSYEEFAWQINELTQQGILVAVKRHGHNNKPIPLALTYRIVQSQIPTEHFSEIERYHFQLHPLIKLEIYYCLSASEWEKDLPYILKIDNFLKTQGLPEHEATAPERAYALVGDEKWIDEKGGRRILERTGVWPLMKIISLPDPLMLAVNARVWGEKGSCHLVVENKTPFHALIDYLPDTGFLSLIYGAGWKVTADIVLLKKQLGLHDQETSIFYFGDLDYEGISIWHALDSRQKAIPALAFYRALLTQEPARGMDNQICNNEALSHFLSFFLPPEQQEIRDILNNGGYYPQEGLNSKELGDIWRNNIWK